MIITEKIEIKVTKSKVEYYKNKGYDVKDGDTIYIKPNDLTNGSHIYIEVECEICHTRKSIMYQKYIKNINNGGVYCCSSKCAQSKVKNTSLKKFGNEYYTQTTEYKEQYKQTCVEKYGTEYHTQSEIIKDKMKNTCIEKYGVDNPSKSPEIIQKIKNVFIEKYGVTNISHLDYIKDKIRQNYKDNRTLRIQQSKDGIIKKHGVDSTFKLDVIKEKIKKTVLERYGDQFGFGSKECREKSMITRLSKWKHNKILNNNNIVDINLDTKKIIYICQKNHTCYINYQTYKNRTIGNTVMCTECNPITRTFSGLELQLLNYIKENYSGEIISNTKSIINPYELDIYLPELKLAFEFNGVYWHNEQNKPNNYHKMKSDMCDDIGIQLIHIWEDDWLYKNNIIKSVILNKIKSPKSINIKNYIIEEITDNFLLKEFLEENHINGYISSSVNIGLFYKNELVSLMTFIKSRKPLLIDNEFELLRFCNKLNSNIIGNEKRLFNYFIDKYNPNNISVNIDRSYCEYVLYEDLGFKLKNKTEPNYYYVIDGIRNNKYNFKKNTLVRKGYDFNKTEHGIMLERKIYRIYNAGNYKYVYNN